MKSDDWIPVDERLPWNGRIVPVVYLAYGHKPTIGSGIWDSMGWTYNDGSSYWVSVTHWLDIDLPVKETE